MSAQAAREPPVPFVGTQTVASVPSSPSKLVGRHVEGVLQPDCATALHPSPGTQTFVEPQYCPATVHCVMPSELLHDVPCGGVHELLLHVQVPAMHDSFGKQAAPHLPQFVRSLSTSTN